MIPVFLRPSMFNKFSYLLACTYFNLQREWNGAWCCCAKYEKKCKRNAVAVFKASIFLLFITPPSKALFIWKQMKLFLNYISDEHLLVWMKYSKVLCWTKIQAMVMSVFYDLKRKFQKKNCRIWNISLNIINKKLFISILTWIWTWMNKKKQLCIYAVLLHSLFYYF